jgi:hypothetical protein
VKALWFGVFALVSCQALAQATGVGFVRSFSGAPFLYEATNKGAAATQRPATRALVSGQKVRVVTLETGLTLVEGDTLTTSSDSSVELDLSGEHWLVHPNSHIEFAQGNRRIELIQGRVTLLSALGEAAKSGLVIGSFQQQFPSLSAGFYVEKSQSDAAAVQGSDMRPSEFESFDVLDPSRTQEFTPAVPENPLDDTEEEPPAVTPNASLSKTESNSQEASFPSASGSASLQKSEKSLEMRLGVGKVFGFPSDSLLRKLWALEAQATGWFHPNVGVHLAFAMVPHAEKEASRTDQKRSYERWNLLLGPMFSSRRENKASFWLRPQVALVQVRGDLSAGQSASGDPVLAYFDFGPDLLSGVAFGMVVLLPQEWQIQVAGEGLLRYSKDEAKAQWFQGFVGVEKHWKTETSLSPLLGLRWLHENFDTQKKLGRLGVRSLETSWSRLELQTGVKF